MIQSGRILGELLVGIPYAMPQAGKEALEKGISLAPKLAPAFAGKATEYYINKGVNKLNKKFTSTKGSGTTLTNNEIKDIMKVIKSSIFLKGTIKKITSQEGGFFNFLRPLMTAGLPIMKSVLTPLPKSVLLPLGLSAGMSAADAGVQNKNYG